MPTTWESELEMKLAGIICCSDPKLSSDKCKNWGSGGKSDLSEVIQQDCGNARTPVNPQIYSALQRQVGDTAGATHSKDVETFTFHRDHGKSVTQPAGPSKEVLISPPRRLEGSEVRGTAGQELSEKWGVRGGREGIALKLCFSNETNHWLFPF